MKNRLIVLIEEAIDLLKQCGYDEKSTSFENMLNIIRDEDVDSDSFKQTISEIKANMIGMGSFSDLSMVPKPDARISAEEARQRQWDLTEDIYEEIGLYLKK